MGKFSSLVIFSALFLSHQIAFARGPNQPLNTQSQSCELESNDLTGDVFLSPDCHYNQRMNIKSSATTLDCQGAQLRGNGGYAIMVKGEIENIVVRNCYLRGVRGIAVKAPSRLDEETDEELRQRAPRNVIIENIDVRGSESVGVHLHPHTMGVLVRDSIMEGNSGPGVYMSPYGKGHHIDNNRIANNGHLKPDGTPKIAWYRREGVAIDGSSEHLIENNLFDGNAFGGVLMYKNCWEHAAENPDSKPRTEYASDNIIRNNTFQNELFGVWVAARQSRDLYMMGCGDPTPYDNPIWWNSVIDDSFQESLHPSVYTSGYFLPWISVWRDYAEDNQIIGNIFIDSIRGGIRIEDDRTIVQDNLFIGDGDYIFVGAPFRARLAGLPVQDTLISNNSFHHESEENFEGLLYLVPEEHTGTMVINNHRACYIDDETLVRHHEVVLVEDADCPIVQICEDGTLSAPYEDPNCDTSEPAPEPEPQPEPEPEAPQDASDGGSTNTGSTDAGLTDSGESREDSGMSSADGGLSEVQDDDSDQETESSVEVLPPETIDHPSEESSQKDDGSIGTSGCNSTRSSSDFSLFLVCGIFWLWRYRRWRPLASCSESSP